MEYYYIYFIEISEILGNAFGKYWEMLGNAGKCWEMLLGNALRKCSWEILLGNASGKSWEILWEKEILLGNFQLRTSGTL